MNVSQEEARASLSSVRDATVRTHRAIISTYANPLLILWGTLWIIAYISTHFYLSYAFHIFTVMAAAGSVGTALIIWLFRSKAPIQETSCPKFGRRIALLWILLYLYIPIWLMLLAPFSGIQCNAFICTACMFAYIVMGLWFDNRFTIVLGLALTVTTLAGFYVLRDFYCLWMAFTGGGALLGAGLYIRLRWR
jgi:hypothetical protein